MTDPFAFALAVLALLGTPGPTNTLLAASGAMRGARRSLPLRAAELGGYLAAILLLHGLLGDLVRDAPALRTGLRVLVGAYLVFVAVRLWLRPPGPAGAAPASFAAVLVTTLLNPKAIVFAFVVIPFGSPWAAAYLGAFSAMTVLAGAAWILAGAWLGQQGAAARHPRIAPRLSAVVLCAFAAGRGAGG